MFLLPDFSSVRKCEIKLSLYNGNAVPTRALVSALLVVIGWGIVPMLSATAIERMEVLVPRSLPIHDLVETVGMATNGAAIFGRLSEFEEALERLASLHWQGGASN
jgi:hypothetical protein